MSYKVTLYIENEQDIPFALQEVANLVNQGYTNGFIGCSSDSWDIEEEK